MSKAKIKKLALRDLTQGQIVWSNYFECYVEFIGKDFDEDALFKFVGKSGYCILLTDEISEPEGLMKELL